MARYWAMVMYVRWMYVEVSKRAAYNAYYMLVVVHVIQWYAPIKITGKKPIILS